MALAVNKIVTAVANLLQTVLERINSPNWPLRLSLKLGLFALVLLLILFPNPLILIKQISHFNAPEQCIQTGFDGVDAALVKIDSAAGPQPDSAAVVSAVEQFVYKHVRYAYDWHSWGAVDYWPPASEVFNKGVEDCDGRAILAVSLLRAYGFESAHLLGNANHMWAAVDTFELMGPRADATFSNQGGATQFTIPGFRALLTSLATAMTVFPGLRVLLLLLAAFGLCLHPTITRLRMLTGLLSLFAGLYFLKDWGGLFRRSIVDGVSFELVLGLLFVALALLIASRKVK